MNRFYFLLSILSLLFSTAAVGANSSRLGNAPIDSKVSRSETSVRAPKNGDSCDDCEKSFYHEGEPENLLNYWDARIFGNEDVNNSDAVK